MKTITSTGDALSKAKAKNETVNRFRTEAVRIKRLEQLAGIYSSDAVGMSCEELRTYRSLEINEAKA